METAEWRNKAIEKKKKRKNVDTSRRPMSPSASYRFMRAWDRDALFTI